MSFFHSALLATPVFFALAAFSHAADPDAETSARQKCQKAEKDGNYRDALEGFRKLALDPKTNPSLVGSDMDRAVHCYQRLNRMNEVDAFRESVIETHSANWRLLWVAARSYMNVHHQGFIIAGEFQRGQHRGGGRVVHATERDRTRALQLMDQARPLAQKDDHHPSVGSFYMDLGRFLLNNRGWNEAWRLQYLSNLAELPDYEDGWQSYRRSSGAPVDEQGNPIYHDVPKSYETAETDGQRWRWCLEQAVEFDTHRSAEVENHFAGFLMQQFGVQTMAQYGWFFGRSGGDDKKDESGTYALHTLSETETIARLASGIKRFDLPDEFNFVKIYRERLKDKDYHSLRQLVQIFENRRQYPVAAELCRQGLRDFPKSRAPFQQRLDQITGNWGRFDPITTQPAGQGAEVDFVFRNAPSVQFTAHAINVEKLLDDVKDYLKSRPKQLDHQKLNIGNLGYRFVQQNQREYVGKQVAKWDLELDPREKHFDRRITVTTPLQQPGAYLLTSKMKNGNTNHIILWVADTTIVKKPLNGKAWYYVADADSGKPVAGAKLDFFGYQMKHRKAREYDVLIKESAQRADDDGQVVMDNTSMPTDYQWIITATTDKGRFAYMGFTHAWYRNRHDAEYNATKTYLITDRPVYRPDQEVHYKFWVRHAKYDRQDTSDFAGKSFSVEIHNPKGERIFQKSVTADEYGGIEGTWQLPADATLGVYRVNLHNTGGGSFRVEEYKKPEYEVTVDAPSEPIMLGEKIEATIRAKYYFGSPVTHAKVKYKIERTNYDETWYPPGPWDWFYGPGYWWFAYDYDWHPSWHRWGCRRPIPFWWPHSPQPPELVADREVEISPDGTVKVEIDTAVAKAIHPDTDHRYKITVEVVDQSRRTIVGSGTVLVARKPFKVNAWVDRGYYRTGDVITGHFAARTLDGKPVEGKGKLQLLQIGYRDGKPVETTVFAKDLDTDDQGKAMVRLRASRSGQYRFSYKLTDAKKHTIEGGYLFTIVGDGFDGSQFTFNSLELIPDKADYRPEEKVKLQVNTDRTDSTVMLFVRPSNGVYLPPRVIRKQGKSTIEEIAVTMKDMPNFFVEAVTVSDGQVYSEVRQIIVPPEKRVLSVDIEPSKEAYQPGEKADVKLKLTDFHGEPFVGSTVVAIYDKSVEYISGGSNVGDIREFFWKWRRHHNPNTESSLSRGSGNLNPPGKPGMGHLGVFGASVAAEMKNLERNGQGPGMPRASRRMAKSRNAAAPMMLADSMEVAKEGAAAEMIFAGRAVDKASGKGQGGGAAMVEPTVRSKFADTALWVGALTTKKDGTADVKLDMPENLTTWRIKVWGLGHGTKVGEGTVDVVTRKDLIVRLQAPRFFVQKDEVVLSANVHNYLKQKKPVQVVLELEGDTLESTDPKTQTVEVAAGDEARVDWRVRVTEEGEAVVRMKALTDEVSDAMEMRFPCYVHGMLKMEAVSGLIRPQDTMGAFTLTVPEERRPEQTRLEVRYSPTLAGALVDALPYLADYPYGCTEQTLNRFVPTVITQKILLDMGLDLKEIKKKRTNLNAQEIGPDRQRAKRWKRFDRNPVFDEAEVRKMVADGVKRLTQMQLTDGGWGWFSGYGEHSSAHTTATVVHGLQIARQNDVAVGDAILKRGVVWLKRYQDKQVTLLNNALAEPKKRPYKTQANNLDALVYMVLIDADTKNDQMKDFLYRDRTKLAVYGMSIYGMALHDQNEQEKLDMILQNINQYVEQNDENQTAWLNLPGGYWWYWYGSEYEAHAYYLKLLARTDPKGELAPRLVKYLLNNRKHATYWNSTRDTSLCVEAMADFLRASGEDKPEMSVDILVDGERKQTVEITSANLFRFDNKYVAVGKSLSSGEHRIELKKQGKGPLYYNGYLTNFTLEDFITKAGLEVKVERKYYRLVKVDKSINVAGSRGQAVKQKVEKYKREELANLATLKSGDLVEIELEIESANDYEYLVFEDMKPAGFEPVDLRSGYTGNDLGAYMEFRDNRVVFFVKRLARGKHSVSYRMRAEIPGRFSALPTKAWAMYAPELKANSDEIKLKVED